MSAKMLLLAVRLSERAADELEASRLSKHTELAIQHNATAAAYIGLRDEIRDIFGDEA